MKYDFKEEEIILFDIHKYDVLEAKYYLERMLADIDNLKIREVIVIHGYNRGKVLQNLVRNELKSKKIDRRFLSLNPGRTSLILRNSIS